MKLSEHVCRFMAGIGLKEITEPRQFPKGYRKFEIGPELFYFVADSGYVLIGNCLSKATTPHSDLLRKIARFEEKNQL